MEMKILYLAWQDPDCRSWYPIGRLSAEHGEYRFVYTKGVEAAQNFALFSGMKDRKSVYWSRELFPVFANRLLAKTRPEYKDFLNWLNLRACDDDPFLMFARTGGYRETDSFMVFGCPEPVDGMYHVHFFSHGLRYLSSSAVEQANALIPGSRLYLMPDLQNQADSYAIALRTGDPTAIVGYCPRFLARDIGRLLETSQPDTSVVKVEVEKVNPEAPIQLRLLCNMTAPWPQGFHPCSEPEFEPLA